MAHWWRNETGHDAEHHIRPNEAPGTSGSSPINYWDTSSGVIFWAGMSREQPGKFEKKNLTQQASGYAAKNRPYEEQRRGQRGIYVGTCTCSVEKRTDDC